MDRSTFLQALDSPDPYVSTDSPPAFPKGGPETPVGTLAPRTQESLDATTRAYNLSKISSERGAEASGVTQKYIEANQRANVPLVVDPDDELSLGSNPWVRMMVARRKTIEDQQAFLEQHFGKDKVRLDKGGHDFIIEMPDPKTGKTRDIKLNEESITLSDIGAMIAGAAPDIAGAVGGVGLARALPGIKKAEGALAFLRDVTAGSVGAEAAGGVSEAEARAETGTPIQPGEIAERRAKNVPLDIAMGYLEAGVLKALRGTGNFAKAPFSFARKDLQNEGLAAAERIQAKTGIALTYDPGEATGFPALIQMQAYAKAHPSGTSRLNAMKLEQDAKVEAFQDYLFGSAPSDEVAGQGLMDKLQEIRTRADQLVSTAKESVGAQAEGRIRAGFGAGEAFPTQTGEKVRKGVLNAAEATKAQNRSNFNKVYELPESKEAIVPTEGLQAKLDSIKANLPDRAKEIESVFYDSYGNPMTKTTEGRELLPGWTHDELKRFLEGGFDPEMPLHKVVEMRDLLYDKISQGQALQGIPNRYLKEMGAELTKAIDQGVSSLPNGELKKRLVAANTFYKEKMLKLNEPGIADLFKTSTEGAGFIESQDVINRLKSDPAKYQRTLEMVGPASPEAEAIRQSIRTDVLINSATSPTAETIDGKKLLANLEALRTGKDTREIFQDVFGAYIGKLSKEGALLGAAQGNIPMAEAKAFLASDRPSLAQLNKLVTAQAQADKVLANELIQKATKGPLDTSTVNPEKFVNSFIDIAKKSDLDQVMTWVRTDPTLERDIQRKTVEKLFADVGPKLNPEGFDKILSDPTTAEKLKSVIGPANWDLIQDFITYQRPRAEAAGIAKGTGQLVKGSAIGGFLRAIPIIGIGVKVTSKMSKEIGDLFKVKLVAVALSNPGIRKWLSSASTAEDFKDLAMAVAVSTPMIKAIAEDFPSSTAAEIISGIKKMTGAMANPGQNQNQSPAPPGRNMSREDFQNALK